jgi:hypothetical protein
MKQASPRVKNMSQFLTPYKDNESGSDGKYLILTEKPLLSY